MERIRTGEGTIRDVEKNVLELCREAFDESDFLRYEQSFRPAHGDFEDMDIINARVSDLPALFAWVDSEDDDGNETGGLGKRRQRNKADYNVMVVYVTHFDLPKEGHKKVRRIGDLLKRKLVANTNLLGIANMGGRLMTLNFDPDLIMDSDGLLQPVSMVRIVMQYSLTEKQQRAS